MLVIGYCYYSLQIALPIRPLASPVIPVGKKSQLLLSRLTISLFDALSSLGPLPRAPPGLYPNSEILVRLY